jgi:hypothetical protein
MEAETRSCIEETSVSWNWKNQKRRDPGKEEASIRSCVANCHAWLAVVLALIYEKIDGQRICQSTVSRKRMSNSQNGSHYERDQFFTKN